MRKAGLVLSLVAAAWAIGACSTGEDDKGSGAAPVIGDPNPNGKPPGETCAKADECRTGVCAGAECQVSKPNDAVKNADESDVDCGGKDAPACENGKTCAIDANCASKTCAEFRCVAPGTGGGGTPGPTCGAAKEKKCSAGEACQGPDDCESKVCDGAKCKAPSGTDGVQNGDESDVDCGGTGDAKRCDVGKTCADHGDCASNGCAFDKKCAIGASCTQLEGGHTCGPNDGLEKQKDCCERATVGGHTIDKFQVTAGRMRAFITRLNGDVKGFAAKLPAGQWNQAWTDELPSTIDGEPGDGANAHTQLGPHFGKRSCESGSYNGHTYWTPLAYGDPKEDFPKEVLDTKALNCVPWHLLAALCAFDGGHLLKEAELRAAYTNGGTTSYPWGARDGYSTVGTTEFAIQAWSYGTPNPPADARKNGGDFLDSAYHIAPPGRRPAGYNQTGHADLVGNLLEWVGDGESQFVWKGSWERHAEEADKLSPGSNDPYLVINPKTGRPFRWNPDVTVTEPNGYYALGGRCAY